MNRIIKFRAWDKKEKEIVTDKWIMIEKGKGHRLSKDGNLEDTQLNLMQFTGLKDKNGKEIYEGDIVHFQVKGIDCYGDVYFEKGRFWVRNFWNTSFDEPSDSFNEGIGGLNVVGNIYENSELLTPPNK